MNKIQQLYAIERTVKEKELSIEEIKKYRQKHSAPIMDEIEKYVKEQVNIVLPKR